VETGSMLSNRLLTNLLATLKLKMSKFRDPFVSLTSIYVFAAEELLAVRVQKLGTIGK
jgi:hypothetical protein